HFPGEVARSAGGGALVGRIRWEGEGMRRSRSGRLIRACAFGLSAALVVWLLLLGTVPVAMAGAPGEGDEDGGGSLVHIDTGLIRGARSGGVDSFLGIPYAQPPVGQLR